MLKCLLRPLFQEGQSCSMFTARPSNKDTEEDLLKYQKEFLSSQTTPAVTVVRAEKRKSDDIVKSSLPPAGAQQKDVVTLGGTHSTCLRCFLLRY